ncbi:MAG: tetratricopeptide repeat protein [Myxococcota bacterium]
MTRRAFVAPALLCAAVALAYAPSQGGGFLEWDDGWLVRDNAWLRASASRAWPAFVARFDLETRTELGAEYLPVRDTLVWIEVALVGLSPAALRAFTLAWYLCGVLLLRAYLRRTLADRRAAEVATWLFALHPLHVEGAAWISSHKDVLAFALVAAALLVHAGGIGARRAAVVVALLALAHFAKSSSVIALGLLLAHDLYVGRRLSIALYAPAAAVAIVATSVHVHVGRIVAMTAALPPGGRLALAATMGPVWLRDLAHLAWPAKLSALYAVPDRAAGDVSAWIGWAVVAALALGAAVAWRRGAKLPALALAWLILPRLPTSQVLAPLQNRMADRYLFLCVLAPALLAGAAAARWWRVGRIAAAALALALAITTAERAAVFSGNLALWADTADTLVPQLRRPGRPPGVARATLGNLATALVAEGRLADAERLYRAVVARWPDDPKALNNLAELAFRQGRAAESRALFDEVVRRFPRYELGRQNYRLHFGEPPAR